MVAVNSHLDLYLHTSIVGLFFICLVSVQNLTLRGVDNRGCVGVSRVLDKVGKV